MKSLLRMLVIVLVLGMTMTAGATVTVYDQPFDSGMTGTIWLEGNVNIAGSGTEWYPYFSGGANGTPSGSMALYHNQGQGNYCKISGEDANYNYYWSRPSVNNVFTIPGGATEVTISYDFWRDTKGWTLYPHFAGFVQFTDNVTYPDEYFSTTSTSTTVGGWTSISETKTYTGAQVIASIKLFQINTMIYDGPAGGIDGLVLGYDNLLVTAEEIPEPATIMLLSLGGLLLRRKK